MIRANTGRVEIDNPDGFTQTHFASMDAMSARVKLLPLLSKHVEITSFTLKNPLINLETTIDGRSNWVFNEDAKSAKPVEDEASPFRRDGRYSEIDPAIGRFALEGGTISYVSTVDNASHTLKDVNIDFSVPSLSQPISIDGSLIYNCLLYTSPSPRDATLSRMPSSA